MSNPGVPKYQKTIYNKNVKNYLYYLGVPEGDFNYFLIANCSLNYIKLSI